MIRRALAAIGLASAPKPGDEARSTLWPKVRAAWIKDHPRCAACSGTKRLQVHHKRPFHAYPALELDPANFITLCEEPSRNCHLRIGHAWNWHCWNPCVVEDAALSLRRFTERKCA